MSDRVTGIALFAATLAFAVPAGAIVNAPMPMQKVYDTSGFVLIGKATAVGAGTVNVAVTQVVKGSFSHKGLRISLARPADLPKAAAAGMDVVLFQGQKTALVHLADDWLIAGEPVGNTARWHVPAVDASALAPLKTSFPGRTGMLLRLLADMQAGMEIDDRTGELRKAAGAGKGSPIVDAVVHKGFKIVEKVGDLGIAGATCVWSGDIEKGSAVPNLVDLVAANGKVVRLFRPTGAPKQSVAYGPGTRDKLAGYVDATADYSLDKAPPCRQVAAGDADGDGRPDLLLGNTLWLRQGAGFTGPKALGQLPTDDSWAAAAIADATGDDKCDIVVLLKDGSLITLRNTGGPAEAWPKAIRKLWDGPATRAWAVFSKVWSGAGELCVIVVRNGNVARYPCGPTEGPADDLEKLCGTPMSKYYGFTTVDTSNASGRSAVAVKAGTPPHPLKDDEVLGCTTVDLNGRCCLPDFLLLTRNKDAFVGGLPMGYRGYGAFLYNRGIVHSLDKQAKAAGVDFPPGTIPVMGSRAPGAGTRQHLLLLKPNGELWQVFNAGG